MAAKHDSVWQAFNNGADDRRNHGLLRQEQLCRSGPWQRFGWRLGWEVANALTRRPLRNAKPTPAAPKEGR